VVLARSGATERAQATLAQPVRQLDELFHLVVVGEFNAGKSAFVNALLGTPVLEEGVTPTTVAVEIHRYGGAIDRFPLDEHLYARTAAGGAQGRGPDRLARRRRFPPMAGRH
jgi:hypothetical protein